MKILIILCVIAFISSTVLSSMVQRFLVQWFQKIIPNFKKLVVL